MTRCPEFYEKWEKTPNWCNKCQSAVSQIDNYLGLVGELEKEGVDRKISFAILPETVARGILTVKDRNKERTVKNLAEYLKSPNCTKIRVSQTHGFIQRPEPRPYKEHTPSYETKIRQNEKKIEEYRSRIKALEQENVQLKKCIARDTTKEKLPVADSSDVPELADDFIKGIDRMLARLSDTDTFETREKPGTMKIVGQGAALERLARNSIVPEEPGVNST